MVTECVCGPLFFRENRGPVTGHCHEFDHVTLIVRDRWRARKWVKHVDERGEQIVVDGVPAWLMVKDRVLHPGERVLIEANAKHAFDPLGDIENPLALCIYPHRTPEGDIVLCENGWDPAYQLRPDGPHGFDPHPSEGP